MAIRDRDALRSGEAAQKVRLQGEAADEQMAERLGYRSMRSSVEINCETRRDRVVEMEVFPQHDLKGPGERRPVPGGWVQPSEDAYLADVIRAVCRAPSPPAPAETQAAAPRLRPTVIAAAKAPVALARAAPPPSVAPAAAAPRAEPARLMSLVMAPVAPLSAAPATGGFRAQVGALNTEADARRALDRLAPTLPRGVSTRIETATVGGRVYYRALVAGFSAPAQVQAFCAEQQRRAQPCLIR